ncbi:MAG: thioredoxin family protein [Chitinophagales bacterium]
MKWNEYNTLFEQILSGEYNQAPYNSPEYMNYVKMNQSRSNRWLKGDVLNEALVEKIKAIDTPQQWIVITEPWCGDAAHSVPVLARLSQENPLIDFKIELRDNGKNMIDNYLTNGGKSIPKLVVRNSQGEDLFTWGPRPKAAQQIMLDFQKTDLPIIEKHKRIQKWYAKDKGASLQEELMELLVEVPLVSN